MRALVANTRLTVGAVLLFGLAACGSPHDSDLFRRGTNLGGNGGAGAATVGGAASDSAGACNCAGAAAGTQASAAGYSGGDSSIQPNGGAGSGGTSDNPESAGRSGASLSDCDQYGPDASYFPETRHCYLVLQELATFDDARQHCQALGAHLVTLADSAEDDFAWSLDSEEHWIGSTDGKGPTDPSGGTFTWLTGEPFNYSNWSPGQPNISDTDCGASGISGHCYEHCVFQWKGGDHDGQWNDRFCQHTIPAICEWDSAR